jgi:hypothetical protein
MSGLGGKRTLMSRMRGRLDQFGHARWHNAMIERSRDMNLRQLPLDAGENGR